MNRRSALLSLAAPLVHGCASLRSAGPDFPIVGLDHNRDVTVRVRPEYPGNRVAQGTGVVVARNGYILTCLHNLDALPGTPRVEIIAGEGANARTTAAVIRARDPVNDLALLKVEMRFPQQAELAVITDDILSGKLYAVGYPQAAREAVITRGFVRRIHYAVVIDKTPLNLREGIAADIINDQGASGAGVFLASNGQLVGIHKMSIEAGMPDGVRSILISSIAIRAFLQANGIALGVATRATSLGRPT